MMAGEGPDTPSGARGAASRRVFLSATAGAGLAALLLPSGRADRGAERRIGQRFLADEGLGAGLALVAAQDGALRRLRMEGRAFLEAAVAADFRAGRTVSVAGVRMSALETARCVASALGRRDLV
jgi:hypothetical protein